MKKVILFTIAMFFFIFPVYSYAFETICSASFDVTLDYTISNGKVLESCINEDEPSVFMTVESDVSGQLTVDIPKTMVYAINQECDPLDLVMLLNGDEVFPTIQNISDSRVITLDFPAGYNVFEFLGTYTLGLPVHAYCGVIYGVDSVFMPPKFQTEHGMEGSVLCNAGLEVMKKPSDDSQICVKPDTSKKLIERGWEPGKCNSVNAAPSVNFRYCSFIGADFGDKDLQGADLYNARFEGANLSNANLKEANIDRTYFVNANLSGADISGLDLTGAILKNTNVTGAIATVKEWNDLDPEKLIGFDTINDLYLRTIFD